MAVSPQRPAASTSPSPASLSASPSVATCLCLLVRVCLLFFSSAAVVVLLLLATVRSVQCSLTVLSFIRSFPPPLPVAATVLNGRMASKTNGVNQMPSTRHGEGGRGPSVKAMPLGGTLCVQSSIVDHVSCCIGGTETGGFRSSSAKCMRVDPTISHNKVRTARECTLA